MVTRHFLLISAILLLTVTGALAQADASTAPIKWERYVIPNRKVSLMLPKLPTMVDSSDLCRELERKSYYAYADHIVYEAIIAAKSRSKRPEWCPKAMGFGPELLSDRLGELRVEKLGNSEASLRRFDRQVFKFENGSAARWIVSDVENGRWVELAIHGRENRTVNEERFLDSLDLNGSEGKAIGDGASTTLGDVSSDFPATPVEQKAMAPDLPSDQKAAVVDSLRIISKPRARYTDAARRANVQGNVLIKVTMLSNGSVGTVTPVKELPHGMTEQAIGAAKRLVFLPKRVNGVPVSVTQTFEYTFSIY